MCLARGKVISQMSSYENALPKTHVYRKRRDAKYMSNAVPRKRRTS